MGPNHQLPSRMIFWTRVLRNPGVLLVTASSWIPLRALLDDAGTSVLVRRSSLPIGAPPNATRCAIRNSSFIGEPRRETTLAEQLSQGSRSARRSSGSGAQVVAGPGRSGQRQSPRVDQSRPRELAGRSRSSPSAGRAFDPEALDDGRVTGAGCGLPVAHPRPFPTAFSSLDPWARVRFRRVFAARSTNRTISDHVRARTVVVPPPSIAAPRLARRYIVVTLRRSPGRRSTTPALAAPSTRRRVFIPTDLVCHLLLIEQDPPRARTRLEGRLIALEPTCLPPSWPQAGGRVGDLNRFVASHLPSRIRT